MGIMHGNARQALQAQLIWQNLKFVAYEKKSCIPYLIEMPKKQILCNPPDA
jgi:hypothetical protein